jgi:lysophospholipase L1-like esterase
MVNRLHVLRALVVCGLVSGFIVYAPAQAKSPRWVTTWAASPSPPTEASGPFPASPHFANQTLRQVVRISAGGTRVRVRLTNEYGRQPLHIGAAHLAIAAADGRIQPGTDHLLTFAGQASTYVPAGAPLLSDPVEVPVPPLSTLAISLYLPEETGACTCHPASIQTMYVSGEGDFTAGELTGATKLVTRAFVSGVEVENTDVGGTIVVFGDSISDGVGSTLDANRRWPDRLAERLNGKGGAAFAIANEGISGNRLLGDGAGQSALARFDRDVLATPGAAYVMLFEGINDIGLSYGNFQGPMAEVFKRSVPARKSTAQDLIEADRQLIARAHAKGLKVIGATLTPYEGAAYYSPEGEAVRQAVNQWIRTSGAFDGVVDFDAVVRDPAHPAQFAAGMSGDHLHGNDAGYEAMAHAIDLRLFR